MVVYEHVPINKGEEGREERSNKIIMCSSICFIEARESTCMLCHRSIFRDLTVLSKTTGV